MKKVKITTIMGANGCGKSTLFSLMTKKLISEKGKYFPQRKEYPEPEFKKNLPERLRLFSSITVHQTISPLRIWWHSEEPHIRKMMQGDSAEDERMIQWALEVTNLTEYRDREVSRLSGGQRQRVWIAMALCQGTKTLFLDEPTTYLDIRYQIEILQLVKKTQSGIWNNHHHGTARHQSGNRIFR